MRDDAIRSVAVLGGGVTGLSAALAFARALPQVQVTLIRTPPDPAALADQMPGTSPAIFRFHDQIGLSEADVIRAGAANWRLGTRFENWSASGESWIHAFGETGLPAGIVPFHQIWAGARQSRGVLPYHAYSAGAVLAAAGKFVHPEQDPRSVLSTYDYALRLEPDRYAHLLGTLANERRIAGLEGDVLGIERGEDGGIAALTLDQGRRIAADLFIDCSGPSSALLSGADFDDWSAYLICDRLTVGVVDAEPSSCDYVRAVPDGWVSHAPLPDRTLTVSAHASRFAEKHADIAIRPGRLKRPWHKNLLAIGDGAVALDPLAGANLDLAQRAILRALDHLPGRTCHPVELNEYNRRTALEVDRARDFTALHYLRSGRDDEPFWREASRMSVPAALAHTLQQFERRGRLPFHEEECFAKESWLAVLLGLGAFPKRTDPLASAVMVEDNLRTLNDFAADLAKLPARLPAYADYFAHARR